MGGLGLGWGGTRGPKKPAMVWPLVVGPPPGLGVGQEGPGVDLQGGLWSVLVKRGHQAVEGRPGGYCPSLAIAGGPFKWPLGLPCHQQPPLPAGIGAPTSENKLTGGSDPFGSPEAMPTLLPRQHPQGPEGIGAGPTPLPRPLKPSCAHPRGLPMPCPDKMEGLQQ